MPNFNFEKKRFIVLTFLNISEHNIAKFSGIDRLWNDGVFEYISGGNVNYTNWRIGEPDNTGDCVELQKV